MKQQSLNWFRVEEVFLGNIDPGQHLSLPNFKLAVADTSTPVAGMERIEPIYENTRILASATLTVLPQVVQTEAPYR